MFYIESVQIAARVVPLETEKGNMEEITWIGYMQMFAQVGMV